MNPVIAKLLQKEVFLKATVPNSNYVIYDKRWLLDHLEEEFKLLKDIKNTPIKTFTKEDFASWMEKTKIENKE